MSQNLRFSRCLRCSVFRIRCLRTLGWLSLVSVLFALVSRSVSLPMCLCGLWLDVGGSCKSRSPSVWFEALILGASRVNERHGERVQT